MNWPAFGVELYSFDVQSQGAAGEDPAVAYPRRRLPSANPFGRLHLPLPSPLLWRLLRSDLSMAICPRRVFCWC